MRIYPVDKPLGLSSHGAVAQARRLLGTRRVGHAGTLDPLATGVLLLLVGEATKLSPYLTGDSKEYLAWVALGAGTPTLDAEGPVTSEAPPADLTALSAGRIEAAAQRFLTITEQTPPAYSAIKQGGRRSYQQARRGDAVEPPARSVTYHRVELLAFAHRAPQLPAAFAGGRNGWRPERNGRTFELPPALADLPTALLSLKVSAGTYVRSFARDLGAALGVPAHLAGLVRTASGSVDLNDCIPLTALADSPGMSPAAAITQPQLRVNALTAQRLRHGQRVPLPVSGLTAVMDEAGELVAMVKPSAAPGNDAPNGTARAVRILRAWQR